MITTPPITPTVPVTPAQSKVVAANGGSFSVVLQAAQRSPAAASAAAATVNPMLLHEIAESENRRRDREAHRRGRELLNAMTELQRLTLGAEDAEAALERIAGLLSSIPQATDTGLASTLQDIALRATIEVSRRRPT